MYGKCGLIYKESVRIAYFDIKTQQHNGKGQLMDRSDLATRKVI